MEDAIRHALTKLLDFPEKLVLRLAGKTLMKSKENERRMKAIIALIKPFKVQDVKESLHEFGITGMTIVEAKGFGRQKGNTDLYRGAEYVVDFLPKALVLLVLDESKLEKVVECITNAARTGRIGDGKVFILDVDDAITIRTGERGHDAIENDNI